MQKVIEYFNALGKDKVHFTPPIKMKMSPHSKPSWIDNMYRIKDNLMVTISTEDDDFKKPLEKCDEKEISSIKIRLFSMQPKQPVNSKIK